MSCGAVSESGFQVDATFNKWDKLQVFTRVFTRQQASYRQFKNILQIKIICEVASVEQVILKNSE